MKRSGLLMAMCLCLLWVGGVRAAATGFLGLNEALAPGEQYRRLSLILLIGEGIDDALLNSLQPYISQADTGAGVDPDELKTPLVRIVDQESMLAGTAFLFRLARDHGAEIGQQRQELAKTYPGQVGEISVDGVREDSILVRNAVADSMVHAGLDRDPQVALALESYRMRTLQLRNLMEFDQFDRELDRITDEAIASVGGKLDAYQRMFDDEVQSETFDRHIRAAEYLYAGRTEFDKNAGKVTEQIMEGVVLSESQPDP